MSSFLWSSRGAALLLSAGLAFAGCAPNSRIVQTGRVIDPHVQHAIVLVKGERTIDIFDMGGTSNLGARREADIRAFSSEYKKSGQGPLYLATPRGKAGRTASAVFAALRKNGIDPVSADYEMDGRGAVVPVKLTFARLQATTAQECGKWPSDLSGVDNINNGWSNQPWENFGCSYQNAFAQQVADPLDLVRSRPETPGDPARKLSVMIKYRDGQPSAVEYTDRAARIGNVGGN